MIGTIRDNAPAAIVIDLDRLPSHGRAVATALRTSASTCHIPIVFAGGTDEKVEIAQQEHPEAVFAPWKSVAVSVRKAIKNAPLLPVKPRRAIERYPSGLARKLGLLTAGPCALIGAPEGFADNIADLPEEYAFQSKGTSETKLIVWFVRSADEMAMALERSSVHMPIGASLWIVHPKRSGSLRCDFVSDDVRRAGIEVGLVDYKICAVDDDWTGMKFARKRK